MDMDYTGTLVPQTDPSNLPYEGGSSLRDFFQDKQLATTPGPTPDVNMEGEITLKSAHVGRLLRDQDMDTTGFVEEPVKQTQSTSINKSAAAQRIAARKTAAASTAAAARTASKPSGILDLDTMKLLFSTSGTASTATDRPADPKRSKARVAAAAKKKRTLSSIMDTDPTLNVIVQESMRTRELQEQMRPNSEPGTDQGVSHQGASQGPAKKKSKLDRKKERKAAKAAAQAKSFGRFQQSLKIVPRANSQDGARSNGRPIKAAGIPLAVIAKKAGISVQEYNLIETRVADVAEFTSLMPTTVRDELSTYVDTTDEAMCNIVSRTEAEAVLSSLPYPFTPAEVSQLCTASMEHPFDPNSVLFKVLTAKTVKLYRFNMVVEQLGGAAARRAISQLTESATPPTDPEDPTAAFMSSITGNLPTTHRGDLPPLKIQEAIATRHLQRDGNFDGNYGRMTPHLLLSHDKVSIQDLRRELEISEKGLEMLNGEVKKGVQWVQLHCPTAAKNNRAKKYCKQWGVEKLKRFLVTQDKAVGGKAFSKWLDFVQYGRNVDNVRLFVRIKACSKIYNMLSTFCLRQTAHGLNQWRNAVISERNREYLYCSIEIIRIVRGFNSRCYTKELRRDAAACKIQNRWKCKKAGEITKLLMIEKEKNDAAKFLQTRYRNYRARGEAKNIMWGKKEGKSATLLQSRIRGREDRARVAKLREEKEMNQSASVLQNRFRGFEAKKEVARKREEKRRDDAAKRLQKWRRGVSGALKYAHKKMEKESANKIQSAARIHLAKKTMGGKLQAYMQKKQMEEEDKAARIMQGKTRQFNARRQTQKLRVKKHEAEEDAAARIMQGKCRQFNAKRKVQRKRDLKSEGEEQDKAATVLQGRFRVHESKKLVLRKKESKRFEEEEKKRRWEAQNDAALREEMEEQDKAARIMQGKARQFGARKEVDKKRTAKLRTTSCKIIQRAYRTHRFLMKFNRKAAERKKKWMAEAEAKAVKEEEERVKREAKEAAYAKKKAEMELQEQHAAATKIQVVFRGRRARRKMEKRRNELAVLEAAAEAKRVEAETNAAAQMIANFMRGATAKIKVRKKKEMHEKMIKDLESAGDLGVAEIEKMKKEMQAEIQAMELSADMQAQADRKDLMNAKLEVATALSAEQELEAQQDEVEMEAAAMKIQHAWKARKSRQNARAKRKEKIALMNKMKEEAEREEREAEDEERAQRAIREQMDGERRKKKAERELKMHSSATKIQGLWRTRCARKEVAAKKAKMLKQANKHGAEGRKLRKQAEKEKEHLKGLRGVEKERKLKQIELLELNAKDAEEAEVRVRREGIMGAMAGDLAVSADAGKAERERRMQIEMMEQEFKMEEAARLIQNVYRCRAARQVLRKRKEIAYMKGQSGDMRYTAPASGPPLGTFIRPGSIHRLEKYGGEMVPFGDDMEANMDAMAAEFVKRENGKAAKDFAERRKMEKLKAVQDLAIAKKEFSIAFGEDFDVADKKSVESIVERGVEDSKKAVEEASMKAAQAAEEKMRVMEQKFETRLKQLEMWERKLEAKEKGLGESMELAESKKLMALHATAEAQNSQESLRLNREREEIEIKRREVEEREKGAGSRAMVSSNPEEVREMNEKRAITPTGKGARWKKLWDDEAKSYYYMNEESNAAQWERPEGRGIVVVEGGSKGGGGGGGGGESGGEVTDYDTDNAEFAGYGGGGGGGSEWQEFQSDDGTKYWYSSKTGESVWEDPNGGGGGGGGGSKMDEEAKKWVSHIDPGTGVAYWYNAETQETKWEDTP